MAYKHRLIETKLKKLATHFPVITLTGARQVGKTTMLEHLLSSQANGVFSHITFDPIVDVGNARQDPELFLNNIKTPALLDEIQYAPELVASIKRRVDEQKYPGSYWLTGSQNLALLKNIAESLAGRTSIQYLYPMSLGEKLGKPTNWIVNFIHDPIKFLKNPPAKLLTPNNSIYEILWRGGYPGLIETDAEILQAGLDGYLHTYLERDIRLMGEISDLHDFSRFLQLAANLTAQEINYSQLGRDIGINPHTAKRWLNILQSTFQWLEIPAFSNNTIKRVSGKNKGYFIDTGMASHLLRITSPDSLAGHPRLGALFETFVVQDIYKQLNTMPLKPNIYHWRSHGGAEIDLLLEIDNRYFPIEIKLKSRPSKNDASGIVAFRETYPKLQIETGIIIAPVNEVFALGHSCYAVPFDLNLLT